MKTKKFLLIGASAIIPALSLAETSAKKITSNTDVEEINPIEITGANENPADEFLGIDDRYASLQELTVEGVFCKKQSPLRLTTVDGEKLQANSTARNYPELLKSIPGIYATTDAGNYGDAKLNIRGFKQENISVLLNGISISGLTSGGMYWNNWMGLNDATHAIQLQKGVGASMLSDSSVGGSVNIITNTTSANPKTEVGLYLSQYGTTKGYLSYNSGRLKNGWGVNLTLSYVGGNGYVESTNVQSVAYLLSVSKVINPYNTILFTALGAPEQHEQRSSKLTYDEMLKYGRDYSKNWGMRDGHGYNVSQNNYYKPYFTLQHIYNKNAWQMKHSIYSAIASGGGRWKESAGKSITSFLDSTGHIDWNAVYDANTSWSGAKRDGIDGIAAQNILTDYQAGHIQVGAIAEYEYSLNEDWKLSAGAHYQHYKTWEREFITDLLGADYWYEDYANKSLAGLAERNPIKHVGDAVRTRNGKMTNHVTAYASSKYSNKSWEAFLGASLFYNQHQRRDWYNYYGGNIFSGKASGYGFSVKGGALYKIDKHNSVYANCGYYSRLPYSSVYFASGNNEVTAHVENEKNVLTEIGYRYVYEKGSVEVNAYSTWWMNKSLMSNKYKAKDDYETRYMITGLDALHFGVEIEANHQFTNWLEGNLFASVGNWKWQNDVDATIYDDYSGNVVDKIQVYSKGLPVGDAPQTQIGASFKVKLPGNFYFTSDWQFNDRMYADFEPSRRTNPNDRKHSYKIPGYHLLNATFGWKAICAKNYTTHLFITGANLLDTVYLERATDGNSHDRSTVTGYWGAERNFSFGVRVTFDK